MTLRQAGLALYHKDAQDKFSQLGLKDKVSPIIAQNPELITMYSAVTQFGPSVGAKSMLNAEKRAAEQAIESGIYGSFRCVDPLQSAKNRGLKDMDCARIGNTTRCFCGHSYKGHKWVNKRDMGPKCTQCNCNSFKYVPTRPEEAGEWWLPRRKNFDVKTWRAKCKCQHSHEEHDSRPPHRCVAGCSCSAYTSAWLCVSCDRHWEQHETVFETESERKGEGRATGEDYIPLKEIPEFYEAVFEGKHDQAMNQRLNPPRPSSKPSLPFKKPSGRVVVEDITDLLAVEDNPKTKDNVRPAISIETTSYPPLNNRAQQAQPSLSRPAIKNVPAALNNGMSMKPSRRFSSSSQLSSQTSRISSLQEQIERNASSSHISPPPSDGISGVGGRTSGMTSASRQQLSRHYRLNNFIGRNQSTTHSNQGNFSK